MRILVTCDRYPSLPLDGLTLRIHHYARYLSTDHELDLVCLGDDTEGNPEIEEFFGLVLRFPHPRPSSPKNFLSRVIAGFAPGTLYPKSPEMQSQLVELGRRGHYDLIWDAGCNMLFNVAALRRSVPLLADQVDDAFLRMRREMKLASTPLAKLWTLKHMALTWIFSFQHVRNAGAVLFVSQADAGSFKRFLPFANTAVIENGVDETYFYPVSASFPDAVSTEIVFEGSMSFGPNIDAAQYFVGTIFPLIRKEIPHAHFTVVGRNPSDDVLVLSGAGVEVTGSVPDIRPYLQKAGVFVCPMRGGAGIKNKILQAWAMSKAVVSTSAGVGSLKISDGENILVRDTPQGFADAVADLLQNPAKTAKLGEAGRATIEAHYTWAAKSLELEALMERIVHNHSSGKRR